MMFNSRNGILALVILAFVVSQSACSTTKPTEKQYETLRASIERMHDSALFQAEQPFFMVELSSPDFKKWFVERYCQSPENTKNGDHRCEDLYKKAVTSTLMAKYFASDRKQVEAKCFAEPLLCMEPDLMETVIRKSHNQNIEASRASKLEKLELWKKGELSESELRSALGLSSGAPLASYTQVK